MKIDIVVNRISNPKSVTQSQAQVRVYVNPGTWYQLGVGTGNNADEARRNALAVASVQLEKLKEQCDVFTQKLED